MSAVIELPAIAPRAALEQSVQRAFVDACLLDVMALKPGNVGIHGSGHGMGVADFIRSTVAAAPAIAGASQTVGERIYRAIAATQAAVGMNTNLGIVLLAAPLAQAAHLAGLPSSAAAFREALTHVLDALTIADAQLAFDAIRLANPGGLGAAEQHDVREPASVSLLEAMREAADRDSIARQYANAYADVVDVGLARFHAARAGGWDRRRGATEAYLGYLAALPDTHVARKFGPARAQSLRRDAAEYAAGASVPGEWVAKLRGWDVVLKSEGLNPGTSADLTVAALFWDLLRQEGIGAGNNMNRGME
jgi:triphosphoribosyl-dephospho-CoA synthase